MDDLISRKAAIDAIEKTKTVRSENNELYVAKINAEMNIMQLPSAEPEPSQVARDIATIIENEKDMRVISERKVGRWIEGEQITTGKVKIQYKKCSRCEEESIYTIKFDDYEIEIINDHCPNCGADMREVEHDI